MKPDRFPFAIMALLALIALTPVMIWYADQAVTLREEDFWLAGLSVAAIYGLFISSWVKPEWSGVVLGMFMLLGFMIVIPYYVFGIDLAAQATEAHELANLLIRSSLVLLFAVYILTIGLRRVQRG